MSEPANDSSTHEVPTRNIDLDDITEQTVGEGGGALANIKTLTTYKGMLDIKHRVNTVAPSTQLTNEMKAYAELIKENTKYIDTAVMVMAGIGVNKSDAKVLASWKYIKDRFNNDPVKLAGVYKKLADDQAFKYTMESLKLDGVNPVNNLTVGRMGSGALWAS